MDFAINLSICPYLVNCGVCYQPVYIWSTVAFVNWELTSCNLRISDGLPYLRFWPCYSLVRGIVQLLCWRWVNVVMILEPCAVNNLLLFTVLSYDMTVDSKWMLSPEVGSVLPRGGGGWGVCGRVQWWTSKLQNGSMSRIKSLMERKQECGPGLVTSMILGFITDWKTNTGVCYTPVHIWSTVKFFESICPYFPHQIPMTSSVSFDMLRYQSVSHWNYDVLVDFANSIVDIYHSIYIEWCDGRESRY